MKRIKTDGQLNAGAASVSRRSFLAGAAIAATGIAAVGLTGCAPQKESEEAADSKATGTRYTKYPNPDEIGIVHEAAREEEFDVVVVGTGITGLSCSMLLAEQAPEAKVLLIDKISVPGGNTNFAEICDPAKSMTWEDALAAGLEKSKGKMSMIDARLWASVNSEDGKLSAWYFTKHKTKMASDYHYYENWAGSGSVKNLVGEIESDPTYKSIDYRLKTQAIALLMDDDHTCTGVQIKDLDSKEYINVKAKAVMIATGGMGGNAELLQYYTGLDVIDKCMEIGQGQDGDGHLMVEYTAHGKAKGVDPTSGWVLVKDHGLSSAISVASAMQYKNVFVNQTGTRFNTEDYTGSRGGQDHDFNMQGRVYSIMSEGIINAFETTGSDHSAYYYYTVPTPVRDDIEAAVDNQIVFKADTFEELAQMINVPVDAFVNEMKRYDDDAKAGAGDTKFGKDAKFMVPFGEGPYYALLCQGILLQTNNGIRINTDSQVVDQYYVPIEGLYAGGICVSGFMTSMRELGISQKGGLWGGLKAARVIIEHNLGGKVADNWYGDKEYDGPLPAAAKDREKIKPLHGDL